MCASLICENKSVVAAAWGRGRDASVSSSTTTETTSNWMSQIVTSNFNHALSANPKALTSRPAKTAHTKRRKPARVIEG